MLFCVSNPSAPPSMLHLSPFLSLPVVIAHLFSISLSLLSSVSLSLLLFLCSRHRRRFSQAFPLSFHSLLTLQRNRMFFLALFKGVLFCHQVWVWLAITSRLNICLFLCNSIIHHRWECPPRCMLDRSVYQPTQWTLANVTYLSIIHLGDWLIIFTPGGIIFPL